MFEITQEGMALRGIALDVTVEEVKETTGRNLIILREVPSCPTGAVDLARNNMVPRRRYVKRCPGESWGPPLPRPAGGSVGPGLRRESTLTAASSRADRPAQAGG
jgi:hypothetical protein